jgi:AraC-like DNA-binding protein
MRILGSYALVYIMHGSGRYIDARGANQKVTAGDLIQIFPDIAHSYGPMPGETWDEIYIVFDGPVFDLWRSNGLLDESRAICRLTPIDYWLRRIESIATAEEGLLPLIAICRLQDLLAEIWQFQHTGGLDDADRAWLSGAKRLLQEPVAWEDFDLKTVADRLAMSYVGFRKKFAHLAGMSPGKFHMKSVMDRACDMMRSGDCTNRLVADRLGFCDEFHFSRRFKQIVGLTPSQFRRQVSRGVGSVSSNSAAWSV